MKTIVLFFCLSLCIGLQAQNSDLPKEYPNSAKNMKDSVLRHVVLFSFKEGTSEENIRKVENAFHALPEKIPEIWGFEWGTNNSPEGLNKGFTHCFFLTFHSEEDRAIYLPHPDHRAFGAILSPWLEDVLVVDYWAQQDLGQKP